ncbi:hypothetical protein [Enterococcus faecium]|uniref:ADP-ribosyltransferase-containing protein n=1 Tax=Enterococcus faecium TaxID=1352 RepID=UPI0022E14637|nr:hypothetical protein [Enterococcus faecium]
MQQNHLEDTIYQIDDINISGEFDYGVRGADHEILMFDNYEWEDILKWGTVIVPETSSYISDNPIQELDDMGFNSLPLNDNHIIKENTTTEKRSKIDNLYHGSKEDFTEFKIPRFHKNGGTLGFGTYLTDSLQRAKSYADNDGYLYTIELNDELQNSTPLNASKVTLTTNQVAKIIEKIAQKQIDEEEYPYILSDWEEPTSETAMDAGNKKIAYNIAEKIIDDTDDLSIINGINNQLGGNDSGAETLIPVLNEMGIHYAELDVEYYDNSKEYVVFNPKDIKIVNQKLTKPEQSKKFVSDVDIKSLEEKAIKTIAKSELIVKANNPVEAMQKLYNNDLKSAIKASFILYDLPEDKIDSSKKNVTWEDLVNIEKSYNVFSYYQNNLYGSELVEPDLNNPYQENTKILDNKATQKQPALSDQYKALHDKLKEPGANKQQIQEQLNKVKIEISQKTQQQLKDFAKANPDLKQPRVKKEQQALQR